MKKTQKSKKNEAASAIPQVITEQTEINDNINSVESNPKSITYVVVRDGYRVSDKNYLTKDDPSALLEKEYWARVEKNHSWGAAVDIVQYDPKKHRTW